MSDIFYDLAQHFEKIGMELKAQAQQSSILSNPSGIGTDREEIYRDFLERHLPNTCDVFLGGYVFDMEGRKSNQIDIIVTAGATPRFVMSDDNRHIAPLEGTIATVECKSRLDTASLKDSLEKCASIPPMPSQDKIVSPIVEIPQQKWEDIPYKVIAAYEAIGKENLRESINNFYRDNPHIPISRRPNIIHIIGQYVIVRITHGMEVINRNGTKYAAQPQVGTYRSFYPNSDTLAIAWMISTLQKYAFLANHLSYNYDNIINSIANRIIESNG